ncbi:ATP-binding protein [Streptomyces wedmorensis]
MCATDNSLTGPAGDALATQRPGSAAPAAPAMSDYHQIAAGILTRRPSRDDRSLPLRRRPDAVAEARHWAQGMLEHWQVAEDIAHGVILVVSELVTNAVEHALAPTALRLYHDRAEHRIWIGVTDGGPAPLDGAWTRSCAHDEHGRGMDLVKALCEAHGTHTCANGLTTHWARIAPATN